MTVTDDSTGRGVTRHPDSEDEPNNFSFGQSLSYFGCATAGAALGLNGGYGIAFLGAIIGATIGETVGRLIVRK